MEAEAEKATTAGEGGRASHTAQNITTLGASNRVVPDDGEEAERGAGEEKDDEMQKLFDKTVKLLKRIDFQSADPRSFKGLKKRLEMMQKAGLPRMRLLPGKILEELRRIPRSTEMDDDGKPYTVDALEMIEREGPDWTGRPKSIIAFFSHRWLRANFSTLHGGDVGWRSSEWQDAINAEGHYIGMPDNPENEKARDLIAWMRWLTWRTSRETTFMSNYLTQKCKDVYFFIDWPCVDQTNPKEEICALPAFVSSCSLIASYFTDEYKGRAWCQAELLVSQAYCALPVVMCVPEGFIHDNQLFLKADQTKLPNPSDEEKAMITNEDDRPTIAKLVECARESRAFTYAQCTRNVASGAGLGKGMGLLHLVISCGLVSLLFRRKVVPGESVIQLVEPCRAMVPYSWSQIKLWSNLSPVSVVRSVFFLVTALCTIAFSIVYVLELSADPTRWYDYLFLALIFFSFSSISVLAFPSIVKAVP